MRGRTLPPRTGWAGYILLQRFDLPRCFQSLRSEEGFPQFLLMDGGPLDDKTPCARRKLALDEGQRFNVNHRFAGSIDRMKMGRLVIPEIHLDDDAVEF